MELYERLEISPERLGDLGHPAALLLDWYHQNKREMPWRGTDAFTPTPYQVWVSEIMLQQTRVEAMRGYYSRFIAQLPDVHAGSQPDMLTPLKGFYMFFRISDNCHFPEFLRKYSHLGIGRSPEFSTISPLFETLRRTGSAFPEYLSD